MKSDNDLPIMVLDSEKDSKEMMILNCVRYAFIKNRATLYIKKLITKCYLGFGVVNVEKNT